MTIHPNMTNQSLQDPSANEEIELFGHRIRIASTQAGWVAFVACQGQRPIIVLATDRQTLLAEARKVVEQWIREKRWNNGLSS
jgi:hypothetical protein